MPELIGSFIITSLLGETAGIAGLGTVAGITVGGIGLTTIVGGAALLGGAIALNTLLTPKGAALPSPSSGQLVTRQALPARRRGYGRYMAGGSLLFSETVSGQRFQIIALHQGQIEEFEAFWFADTQDTLDGSGHVEHLYVDAGNHYVALDTRIGTDSDVAFASAIAVFPTLWTPAHQGNSIAKILTQTSQPKSDRFTSVYPGGQPPIVRALIRASQVWDPRDPAQDRNAKSTWTWNQNPVLHALDFHRHPDAMGLAVFDDSFFVDATITEDWIPAANICDELLLQKDTTLAPRYICCGSYDMTAPVKDVLTAILATCDGQTFQRSDGGIGIRVAKTIAPTVTLDDLSILTYESMKRGSDSLTPVNKVTAKYTEPLLDFQDADADPFVDEFSIAFSGREETRDLALSWVQNHQQARRLMKLAMARYNPQWSGNIITNLTGLVAYGERYVHVRISELLIDGTFEITSFALDPASMTCQIGISSLDQSVLDFDPDTEEGTAPSTPSSGGTTDDILPPTTLAASSSGGVITATWDPPTRTDETADAQYSVHGAAVWQNCIVNPSGFSAVTPTLTTGHYDIQVRWRVGTRVSSFTFVLNVAV